MHVGNAIAAAIARAETHEKTCTRKLRVRVTTLWGDDRDALTINARIAARSTEELECQQDIGTRRVAWDELDERAGELVQLVDDVVAEVEAAFGLKATA
jgi:hypothetical protein